ncbi:DEAD/DEAH box helicase [Gardnerella greenwoodii]|uniref:DEAD/DEAH box helicase n=1 Tax=Gardnerella greenwoodii TaxID=2914925 RepID=UPI003970C923
MNNKDSVGHILHNSQTDNCKNGDVLLSPAQRFAAFREVIKHERSMAADFERSLPFDLDDFQREAIDALEAENNVLVAAPTGAGKTVVADFAVFLAQQRNVKAFYTTPIKALSNQKYHDFCEQYGSKNVGLLTGDTSVNPEADIVVMTTEVLRNMLYENSITLNSLGFVILDEIHYLADKFRGAVWEEVIIHLPKTVKIIGLSATVSNVEDFSAWLESVRGTTHLVVDEHRPVPLERHVVIQEDGRTEPELLDLYDRDNKGNETKRVNPALTRKLNEWEHRARRRQDSYSDSKYRYRKGKKRIVRRGVAESDKSTRRHTPKRWAVIDELDYLGMLPGIYFIFSRSGCDQAVQQCLNAGLILTSDDEMYEIRKIVDNMVANQLSKEDLHALSFERFRFSLEQGFAAHHAGMIALFRHIVETLFERGLIKVVFATETLALGLNMPARSVVVEKLVKFDGTGHVPLTPGEFTQLTGRAGRRGIDDIGHAVLVDHADFVPAQAAALSSKRVYPLHSSFVPTFNMAVNLLHSSDADTARTTLDCSFAQWEANASAQRLHSRMNELETALRGYEEAFHCEQGDFAEFLQLRMKLKEAQHDQRRKLKHTLFKTDAERSAAFKKLDDTISLLREEERKHPCAACPDIQQHLRWGYHWMREHKELEQVRERYESRTGSVARTFDHICDVLYSLDYLQSSNDSNKQNILCLTNRGQLLRRLYNELDIVFAEAICEGIFNNLTPIELLSCLSALVYESRGASGGEPKRYPGGQNGAVFTTVSRMKELFIRTSALCANAHLPALRPLEFGAVDIMYDWAQGADLADILQNTDNTGGDFVRQAKRLIDLLTQLYAAGEYLQAINGVDKNLASNAHEAALLMNRGVVAYSDV